MRAPLLLAVALLAAAPASAQCPADSTRDPEEFYVVEQMPQLIGGLASIRPVYPEAERRAGVEGRVFLQFLVGVDGSVSDVTVTRSLTPALDAAAVEVVRRARFRPGEMCGHPTETRFSLPVNFRLDDSPR